MGNLNGRISALEKKHLPLPHKGGVIFFALDSEPKPEEEIRLLAEDIVMNDRHLIIFQAVAPDHSEDGSQETKRLEDMIERLREEHEHS